MTDDKDWSEEGKRMLKAEMARSGFTYGNLVQALEKLGVSETEANLRNKISRGGFSFAFALQVFAALGVGFLVLDPLAQRSVGDAAPSAPVRKGKRTLVRGDMSGFTHATKR